MPNSAARWRVGKRSGGRNGREAQVGEQWVAIYATQKKAVKNPCEFMCCKCILSLSWTKRRIQRNPEPGVKLKPVRNEMTMGPLSGISWSKEKSL